VITSRFTIDVGGLAVEVVRKPIKHLHLGVHPPSGRVRVAAPVRLKREAVRLAVISRLGWIHRQRRAFEAQERQSEREMRTGESHFFRGRRYLLDVHEQIGPASVQLTGNKRIRLLVRPGADRAAREAVLRRWYRQRLREALPALLAKWQPRVGVEVAEVRIRRMKTRWGSCNAGARRLWLNLELAKKPASCLEYIVVHEMVHVLERQHNTRFRERMDAAMPSWRRYRAELNRAPLAHEDWRY
jgi:predicted metal-dependent hydrolase